MSSRDSMEREECTTSCIRPVPEMAPELLESLKVSRPTRKKMQPFQVKSKLTTRPSTIHFRIEEKQKALKVAKRKLKKNEPIGFKDLPEGLVEEIVKKLRYRSAKEVEDFINAYIKNICQKQSTTHTALDVWNQVIEAVTPEDCPIEQQIAAALMVAVEEPIPDVGKLPPPTKKRKRKKTEPAVVDSTYPKPDFNAIYQYLTCAILNKPLPVLSPINALVVEDCVQCLSEQIKDLEDNDLRQLLRRSYLYLSQDPKKQPEADEQEIRQNIEQTATIFNPLGINKNAIVPVPPTL